MNPSQATNFAVSDLYKYPLTSILALANKLDLDTNVPINKLVTTITKKIMPQHGTMPPLTQAEKDLLNAAKTDNQELFRQVLSQHPGLDINIQDAAGITALQWAAAKGNMNIVMDLLNHPQININVADLQGRTALMRAVQADRRFIVGLLLQAGADPNIQDNSGKTALITAVRQKNLKLIQELLKIPGININIQDNTKNTALTIANQKGFRQIALTLKEKNLKDLINDPAHLKRHYKISQKLGEGAFGSVYLAQDTSTGDNVAIKAIMKRATGQKAAQQKLQLTREVQALIDLSNQKTSCHEAIVCYYDFYVGDNENYYYIIMEYINKDNYSELADFIMSKKKIDQSLVIKIMQNLCKAVQYLHKKNYVHRDIKPENIMVDQNTGDVKLIDFGLACMQDPAATFTCRNTLTGTAYYLAPEVWQFKRIPVTDFKKTDIWSLGIVFYMLATGKRLYTGRNLQEIAANVLRGGAVIKTGNAKLDQLIADMTTVDPTKRIDIDTVCGRLQSL